MNGVINQLISMILLSSNQFKKLYQNWSKSKMLIFLLFLEIQLLLIIFLQQEISQFLHLLPDSSRKGIFKKEILTHMEQEEEMISSWQEEPLLILGLSIKWWKERLDLRPFMFLQVSLLTFLMLLKGTKKMETKLWSLEEKNMELVQVEIGLLKDLIF